MKREEEQPKEFVRGMSLANIIQFLEIEQRTCIIEVISNHNNKGWFYLHGGVVSDAGFDHLEGEHAALEMMSWNDVQIIFKPATDENMQRRIHTDLTSLIVRGSDQRGKDKEALEMAERAVLKQEIDNILSNKSEEDDWQKESQNKPDDDVVLSATGRQSETKNEKGFGMDVQKLNEAIEIEKKDLGEGLLATDIFARADGQSVTGYNSNPQACALFNKITGDLQESLVGSGFPGIGKYYMIDLVDHKMVVVIPLGDYQWGMLIDTDKVQLGLLLNVVMPKIINAFEEAITG